MFKRFLKRFSVEELTSSIHASALSRIERLRADDFQYDPALKGEKNRIKVFMLAACQDRPKVVRLLLTAGLDPNTQLAAGETPLMAAATWNSRETVQILLDAGADPNLVDEDGMTALDMAEQMAHRDVAEMLRGVGGRRAEEVGD